MHHTDTSSQRGRSSLTALAYFIALATGNAAADASQQATNDSTTNNAAVQFDPATLQLRGIDPRVAAYFSQQVHFPPGINRITLKINGIRSGMGDARFNQQGQLCFDQKFADWAGLHTPPSESATDDTAQCTTIQRYYPQARVNLLPQQGTVELLVPTTALRHGPQTITGYQSGGRAALFNYDLLGMNSRNSGNGNNSDNRYLQASSEIGVNFDDWMLRSRQSFSHNNGNNSSQYLYTYLQKSLVKYRTVMQAGEISSASPLFSGSNLYGLQLMPQTALIQQGNIPVVQGIAQSQARVEVRQAGALIYDALLPPGPFTLTHLPLLSSNFDLDVTVIENDGRQQQFSVPSASFYAAPRRDERGYNLSVGKVRQFSGQQGRTPWVATGSLAWPMSRRTDLTVGLQTAQQYYSSGGSISLLLTPSIQTSLRTLLSRDQSSSNSGVQTTWSSSAQLNKNWGASFSWSQQSKGFRTLGDSLYYYDEQQNFHYQQNTYNATINFSQPWFGSASLGTSRISQGGSNPSQRLLLGWSRPFNWFNLQLSYERNLNNTQERDDRNQFYLNIDMPLGTGSLRTAYSRYDQSQRLSTSYQQIVSDSANYTLSTERNFTNNHNGIGGQLNLIPRYTQLGVGVWRNDTNTTYNASLRGGVLAHSEGVTLSPYSIRDNIGIISIGDLTGVKFSTPSGPVWSDYWGRSVVPNLNTYHDTRIEVVTSTLPRNIDINNGLQVVRAGHGAVSPISFPVIKTRRLLLTVTTADGKPLNKGVTISNSEQEFITLVGNNGRVFIEQSDPQPTLFADLPGQRCRLQYDTPEQKSDELYQTSQAICIAQ